jgi:hypothetical protein
VTWDSRVQAIAAIVVTLLTAYGAVRSLRKSNREAAEKIANEKQKKYDEGVKDENARRREEVARIRSDHEATVARIRAEYDAKVALLTSERDDARRERDDGRHWQERYMDLRDGRT